MDWNIHDHISEEIAKAIHSDASPVGIDAKKTHILILKKLIDIEERIKKLEKNIR